MGKWVLEYHLYTNLGTSTEKDDLKAIDESDAIKKARARWKVLKKQGKDDPHCPRLMYLPKVRLR